LAFVLGCHKNYSGGGTDGHQLHSEINHLCQATIYSNKTLQTKHDCHRVLSYSIDKDTLTKVRKGANIMANLTISEQAYQTLQHLANKEGQTPEQIIEFLTEQEGAYLLAVLETLKTFSHTPLTASTGSGKTLAAVRAMLQAVGTVVEATEPPHNPYTDPRYYTTEDWFRHLGMTDTQIDRVRDAAKAEEETVS
jgi:hypothetical protein